MYKKNQTRYFDNSDNKKNNKYKVCQKQNFKSKHNKQQTDVITIQTNLKPNCNENVIDPKLVDKYKRGDTIKNYNKIKTKFRAKRVEKKQKAYEWSAVQSARAELLLSQESGGIEISPGETTTQFKQNEIVQNVDITSATKHFELILNDFGPYRFRYTKNGRHLLLGGQRGHIAAFDWITKRLHCEINVMETCYDVCWLHLETMFAVAQKQWVYIYDNQGIELHCLKQMSEVLRMEFLPYHFLLATSSESGYLSWLDVSIGAMVSQYNTKLGRLSMMTQNPYNALLCLGHSKGVVSMWSPNLHEPVVKMLCHNAPMTGLAVNPAGTYLATSAINKSVKIWDLRQLSGPLQSYQLPQAPTALAFSQRNMLAVNLEHVVEVYQNCCSETAEKPYLKHKLNSPVNNFNFCPYEDVLGIGTRRGFTSILVPGSGEPNFDALEANPYQTKSQRRESEVKSLLEKVPADLICLDPNSIGAVNVETLREQLENKRQLAYVKTPKIVIDPKRRNNRQSSVKAAKTKQIMKENAKRETIKTVNEEKQNKIVKCKKLKKKNANVLDRFKKSL